MTITILPKVKISFSLLLLIIIAGFAGFMTEMLLITFSILFHELGHIFWILLFRGRLKCLELNFFGGNINVEMKEKLNSLSKTFINLGGSNC